MNTPLRVPAVALRGVLLFALLLMLAGCKTMTVGEKNILRKTPDPEGTTPIEVTLASQPLPFKVHEIRAHDGTPLHAVQVLRGADFPTLLYFGGNVSRLSRDLPFLLGETGDMELNLLAIEHRGNGRSGGEASLATWFHDALAAHDYARDVLGIPSERLVVHGFSMGSMKASYVALHRPVAGLVLEGSVSTAEAWADSLMPWYAAPFVRVELADNLRGQGALYAVKRQPAPLLVIVGSRDKQTRPILSEQLFEAAQQAGRPAELLVVKGAGHGNAMADAGTQARYKAWLQDLFAAKSASREVASITSASGG
ncbi:alpha/beta hydrolase [Pseudomarimonas salicorniae]|uniref:S9 family peptidase n=1 Tax=Pseudomarimonas salicorniae TaxID=2933270 RepID=A0ABT0GLC8_9GAMM|nr:prolyl oligopeptidase family serine peptidase [Lysobacter sp. CAU 1642]MCK7595342.1 S9 family peptidase [Lysobacter sp. CAU 1642]